MTKTENRERVKNPVYTSGSDNNGHVPTRVGVYERPERKGPSIWLLVFMAILFLVAAVLIFQLVF